VKFISSHVIQFFIMGAGISLILGLLTPTTRAERTRASILKYAAGLLGIGLILAWVMYILPRNPVRF
jgi:hypothetical protein